MDILIKKAREAMKASYSPYSGFKVGACLEAEDGTLYTGCNIESASFTPTMCAERCAIAKGVSDGVRRFKRVAVVNSGEGYSWPCGVCRQMLAEFSADMEVIVADCNDNVEKVPLSELIPKVFLEIK